MDLFEVTTTGTSEWGTTPTFHGTGYGALDLLEMAVPHPGDDTASTTILDNLGNRVDLDRIIGTALADATAIPGAYQHWVDTMARAVVERISPLVSPGRGKVPDERWTAAGEWWAAQVRLAPDNTVLEAIRARLAVQLRPLHPKGTPLDHHQAENGVRLFTDAATPRSRVRGTAAGSQMSATASDRPSRLRGSLAATASGGQDRQGPRVRGSLSQGAASSARLGTAGNPAETSTTRRTR